MRVFVLYGQGGIVTSFGMHKLADRLKALSPKLQVTTHSWYEHLMLPKDPCILIGYSLGANAVTWNAARGNPVTLGVCYDPSILSLVVEPKANIKRLLLFHNTSIEPWGHAVFSGPQVEKTETTTSHLLVCYNEVLHQKTLAAVKKVIGL